MQDGGALIGKGKYGCIFTSELKCKSGTIKNTIQHSPQSGIRISKLLLSHNAEMEMKISNLIQKIDGWDRYFAVAESMCEPTKNQTNEVMNDIEDCEIAKKARDANKWSRIRVLSMVYRGENLKHYRFDFKKTDIVKIFIQMVEAGAQLVLHDIVHRDLHAGNGVVDKRGRIRFIDYNLSIHASSHVSANRLSHVYSSSLNQEPPDMMLVNAIYHGMDGTRILEQFINKRPIIRFMIRELKYHHTAVMHHLFDMYRIPSILTGNMEEWFHSYWRTIDSWSIGILILEQIQLLRTNHLFESMYQPNRDVIRLALRCMCDMNPNHRFDCVQALRILDPMNPILQSARARNWPIKNPTKEQLNEYGGY